MDRRTVYLGDGVYASYDQFGITLDLRGQDDTTRIVLEESVFHSLVDFGNRMFAELDKPAEDTPAEG